VERFYLGADSVKSTLERAEKIFEIYNKMLAYPPPDTSRYPLAHYQWF